MQKSRFGDQQFHQIVDGQIQWQKKKKENIGTEQHGISLINAARHNHPIAC
jgi:hypothetical protein